MCSTKYIALEHEHVFVHFYYMYMYLHAQTARQHVLVHVLVADAALVDEPGAEAEAGGVGEEDDGLREAER